MDFWWETANTHEAELLRETYAQSTHGLTPGELRTYGISEDDLRYMFDVGWVARDVTPEEREDAQQQFFFWLGQYGYDMSDFDWDDWRDWYEQAA